MGHRWISRFHCYRNYSAVFGLKVDNDIRMVRWRDSCDIWWVNKLWEEQKQKKRVLHIYSCLLEGSFLIPIDKGNSQALFYNRFEVLFAVCVCQCLLWPGLTKTQGRWEYTGCCHYADGHTFIHTTMWPAFSFRLRCNRSKNSTMVHITVNSTAKMIRNVVCGGMAWSSFMAVDMGNRESRG